MGPGVAVEDGDGGCYRGTRDKRTAPPTRRRGHNHDVLRCFCFPSVSPPPSAAVMAATLTSDGLVENGAFFLHNDPSLPPTTMVGVVM